VVVLGAVLVGRSGVGDGVHPVFEAEEELPVVVREAGEEVEVVGAADGADGAGGDAQVAPVARVVVEGVVVAVDLGVDQHDVDEDEVAELGVDDVAVHPHVAQPGLDGDGFHRELP
jgi:hypothetical protein